MFLFLFWLGGAADIVLRGNWTDVSIISPVGKANENGFFILNLYFNGFVRDRYLLKGKFYLQNYTTRSNLIRPVFICGVVDKGLNHYNILGSWSSNYVHYNWVHNYLTDYTNKNANFTQFQLYNSIKDDYSPQSEVGHLISIHIHAECCKKPSSHFDTNISFHGMFISNDIEHELNGFNFDTKEYRSQVKIFGVLLAVLLIFSFYGWMEIHNIRPSDFTVSTLSTTTLLILCSFDISILLFLPEKAQSDKKISSLFWFLFLCYSFIFIMSELTILIKLIYKSTPLSQGTSIELAIGIAISAVSTAVYPQIRSFAVFVLISPFVPQIITNIKSGFNTSLSYKIIIMFTLSRVLFIYYIYIYSYNIFEIHKTNAGMFFINWVLIQDAFVLIQQRRGSSFFVPKNVKPRQFDYRSGFVEADVDCPICFSPISDKEAGVTPCGHSVHIECLQRWMEEKHACPICLAPLPPILE